MPPEAPGHVEAASGKTDGLAGLLLAFLGTPAGHRLNEGLASHNEGNRAEHKRES